MEARLGSDFSDVRIHVSSQAARSAEAISAAAYTIGSEVVFGQGSFDPASLAGRRRLAHELVHVQQQRQGPVPGTDSGGGVAISDPVDSFEQEAEATAARVVMSAQRVDGRSLRGGHQARPSIQWIGPRTVQRCGGIPCDCAADEQDSVQSDSVGPSTLQSVQRASLTRSHGAADSYQIRPQLGTTTQSTVVQRQADQSAPAPPDGQAVPATDLASADDCTADGGTLTAPVFLLDDGVTPEPKLKDVYDDRDRLVLGTIDTTPNGPVRRVQTALACADYWVWLGPIDGKYGPKTNFTLKKFKREHNLQPAYFDDVGPKTMHCLNKLVADCGPPGPAPTPPGPQPTPPGPGPTPPMPSPFDFHPGVAHNHMPCGKWNEIQIAPESALWISPICALNSAEAVAGSAAVTLAFEDEALNHVIWYLGGIGMDYDEDVNLSNLVKTNTHFQEWLRKFLPSRIPTKGWWAQHFSPGQSDYDDDDIYSSWGTVDRLDVLADYSKRLVYLWFKDRYEWHPYYPGPPDLYTVKSGDEPRPDNCVHAAMVEQKSNPDQSAADYWMIGKATVPFETLKYGPST
jgi:hypothetical protein